jgi:signal transduction histidine kinase
MLPLSVTFYLVVINLGAIFLAAVYHTILFIHRRETLLRHYLIYLWVSCSYLFFRLWLINYGDKDFVFYGLFIPADEVLQMATFLFYIAFLGKALNINAGDKRFIWLFYKYSPWVISICLLAEIVFLNTSQSILYWISYVGLRLFLLCLGCMALAHSLKKRKNPYYYYLAAGAFAIIFFGLISTLAILFWEQVKFMQIGPFGWLQFGYFFDVVFFSAAIGYRFKLESIDREKALETILEQQLILQKVELEKIEADYRVREEERLRIAKDLHDDLGSSLSSMQLYVEVIEKVIDNNTKRAKELLTSVKENAQNASENMGDLVWALNTGKALNSTFEERLKNFCYQLLSPKDISCFVEIPDWFNTKVTNIDVLRNLMLVSKECLNNIAKYSQASHCEVAAILTDTQLLIRITDDGIGFDKDKITSGNGLKNIKHRIEGMGGYLIIETAPGEGTSIGIVMPITKL